MAVCSWSKIPDPDGKGEIYILNCVGESKMEARVKTLGANLVLVAKDGKNIVDMGVRPDGRAFGGTPVLYPTPNRVKDGIYRFKGKSYEMNKRGERIVIHGLVRDEVFNADEPVVEGDAITLNVWLDFLPGTDLYEGFPFAHRFGMSFTLRPDGIDISYFVENYTDGELPYGFGVHTFFMRLSGDEKTRVSLAANKVIECDENIMPTGKVIKVEGTKFDMRKPLPVKDLQFDTDFFDYTPPESSVIYYDTLGYKLVINTTDDFNHMQFFVNPGNPFFCVENMTCSINAHNLYADGMVKESGLIILPPKGKKAGVISINISAI
jgi:aldose 1-epimerase